MTLLIVILIKYLHFKNIGTRVLIKFKGNRPTSLLLFFAGAISVGQSCRLFEEITLCYGAVGTDQKAYPTVINQTRSKSKKEL